MHCADKRALSWIIPTLLASPVAMAAEYDAWQYEITPYILTAGLDGKAGIRGVTGDIDMSISDVLDDLQSGFMGMLTARKGPWMYALEGVYFKLEDEAGKSVTGPFGHVTVNGALDLTTKMYVYQGSVGYRVLDGTTSVDVIGGLRYTKLDLDMTVVITTTPAIVFPGGARSASGSESWTDGVVGAIVHHQVSDHVSLLGYADVGGGGSDLTYQLIAGANWEFSKGYTAKAGYRLLDWDYEEDGTVWDMTASGPYLALGIRF
ncbi:MAG TPA: hypothetical protein VIR60_10295 [Gammaproteobacteria bacterium]